MNGFVIFAFFFFLISGLAFLFWKLWRTEKKKNKEILESLEKAEENALVLFKHSSALSEIEADRLKEAKKIQGAQNEEELLDIINNLVGTNNERVRLGSEG